MAWYHVGGCDCPVGCCDCGSNTTTVYCYYCPITDDFQFSPFAPGCFGSPDSALGVEFIDSWEERRDGPVRRYIFL